MENWDETRKIRGTKRVLSKAKAFQESLEGLFGSSFLRPSDLTGDTLTTAYASTLAEGLGIPTAFQVAMTTAATLVAAPNGISIGFMQGGRSW